MKKQITAKKILSSFLLGSLIFCFTSCMPKQLMDEAFVIDVMNRQDSETYEQQVVVGELKVKETSRNYIKYKGFKNDLLNDPAFFDRNDSNTDLWTNYSEFINSFEENYKLSRENHIDFLDAYSLSDYAYAKIFDNERPATDSNKAIIDKCTDLEIARIKIWLNDNYDAIIKGIIKEDFESYKTSIESNQYDKALEILKLINNEMTDSSIKSDFWDNDTVETMMYNQMINFLDKKSYDNFSNYVKFLKSVDEFYMNQDFKDKITEYFKKIVDTKDYDFALEFLDLINQNVGISSDNAYYIVSKARELYLNGKNKTALKIYEYYYDNISSNLEADDLVYFAKLSNGKRDDLYKEALDKYESSGVTSGDNYELVYKKVQAKIDREKGYELYGGSYTIHQIDNRMKKRRMTKDDIWPAYWDQMQHITLEANGRINTHSKSYRSFSWEYNQKSGLSIYSYNSKKDEYSYCGGISSDGYLLIQSMIIDDDMRPVFANFFFTKD